MGKRGGVIGIFQVLIRHPHHHRHAELLRRRHLARRTVQVFTLVNRLPVVGGIEHNRFLIPQLVEDADDKVIDIGHAIVVGIDQFRFRALVVDADALRFPLGEAARVALGVVKVGAFGVENDQMLTGGVALRHTALHLIHQQHIVNALTAVARLGANLLAVGDIVGHRVAVEPHLALHGVQIAAEAQLMQHGKDILLFERPLWVIFRPALAHKHAA